MWKAITFCEIVKDRGAFVRILDDNKLLLLDLLMVVTGVDRNGAKQMIHDFSFTPFDIKKIEW